MTKFIVDFDYPGKIYRARVSARAIEYHYESPGEPPYIKYVCPICKEAGIDHQVEYGENSCPICGVHLGFGESAYDS